MGSPPPGIIDNSVLINVLKLGRIELLAEFGLQ
jgi:hypothetical protein